MPEITITLGQFVSLMITVLVSHGVALAVGWWAGRKSDR